MTNMTREEVNEIIKRIDENVKEVRTQTTKTNGRVSTLEDRASKLEVWKGFITGAIAIISAVLLPLAFIVIEFYLK